MLFQAKPSESGIYLYLDRADSSSPMFLLHLGSLTLAKLEFRGPEGATLLVDAEWPPPDACLAGFADTLERMSPGAIQKLAMLTSEGLLADLRAEDRPAYLAMAAAGGPGFVVFRHVAPRFAIGLAYGRDIDPVVIGPVIEAPIAESSDDFSKLLGEAAAIALEGPLRESLLAEGFTAAQLAAVWKDAPHILARSSPP